MSRIFVTLVSMVGTWFLAFMYLPSVAYLYLFAFAGITIYLGTISGLVAGWIAWKISD
jgi:hypothetical protein